MNTDLQTGGEREGTDVPVAGGCSVNSAFNFSVGAVAIAAAGAIAYVVYAWLVRG